MILFCWFAFGMIINIFEDGFSWYISLLLSYIVILITSISTRLMDFIWETMVHFKTCWTSQQMIFLLLAIQLSHEGFMFFYFLYKKKEIYLKFISFLFIFVEQLIRNQSSFIHKIMPPSFHHATTWAAASLAIGTLQQQQYNPKITSKSILKCLKSSFKWWKQSVYWFGIW